MLLARPSRSAPLIATRLRHALRPPQYPLPSVRTASIRYLSQQATPPPPPPPPRRRSLIGRITYAVMGATVVASGAYAALDPDGAKHQLDKAYDAIDSRIRFFAEPSRDKLLPDATPGYGGAPPPRTLVVDLDKTLVYSSYSRATGWRVAKRPGAEAFLAYLSGFYEVVVFTSSLNSYADPILDRLDAHGYVAHRLYRAETHYRRGVHVKNLDVLNRELDRVIVVDHDEKQVGMHRENAIIVPEWKGDAEDTALLDLIPFLESLVRRDVNDVREELKWLSGKQVAEGVAEYKASVEKKEENVGSGLFGRSAQGKVEVVEEEERERGGVWGSLKGTGRIFHAQGRGAEQS